MNGDAAVAAAFWFIALERCGQSHIGRPQDSWLGFQLFWEARYYATDIPPKEHRRVLKISRHIQTNPKAAGFRKEFYVSLTTTGTAAQIRE